MRIEPGGRALPATRSTSPKQAESAPPLDTVERGGAASSAGPKRILFVHASHTGGHAAAAKAMVAHFNQIPGVQAESLNLQSTQSSEQREAHMKSFNFVSKTMPALRKWGFELAFKGAAWACGLAGISLDLKAARAHEALAAIQERKPDIIVATHSATARMLNYWKGKEQISAPVHCIPTDFRTHRMWKQDCIEHYYVAPGGSKADLVRFGVPADRISETGIPITPTVPGASSAELKAKLGLNPDKPMVLISGGSLGLQPYKKLVEALRQRQEDFQIVCVTAKNETARAELAELPEQGQPVHVTGLVDNMPEWIGASDVVITKPGGLTCSEILAQKKPMVFARLYEGGLETPLTERLEESGVALVGDTVEATAEAVASALSDAQVRQRLQRSVSELSRPDSSARIGQHLLDSL